jgi:hypothetical protein
MKPFTTPVCPTCHQTVGAVRFGARLTLLKARIVDRIKAAGDIGVPSEELLFDLWEHGAVAQSTVKAHIWQINELLEETDWYIRSDGHRWFLSRRAQ